MLEAGGHAAGVGEVVALVAFDRRHSVDGVGVGIFAVALRDAAPAAVARHVDHRREGPLDARHPRLLCGHFGGLLHQCGIPRAGLGQRNGVSGAETVDHVVAEQHGDSEPRLLDGFFLKPVAQSGRGVEVDERADFGGNLVHRIGHVVGVVVAAERVLVELHDLLFEGHPRQQVADALFDGASGVLVGGLSAPVPGLRPEGGGQQQSDNGYFFHRLCLLFEHGFVREAHRCAGVVVFEVENHDAVPLFGEDFGRNEDRLLFLLVPERAEVVPVDPHLAHAPS